MPLNLNDMITELLELRGWSVADLADRLELSAGYLQRLLDGRRPWPVALVFRVAAVFD